jgi:hypothetical protein
MPRRTFWNSGRRPDRIRFVGMNDEEIDVGHEEPVSATGALVPRYNPVASDRPAGHVPAAGPIELQDMSRLVRASRAGGLDCDVPVVTTAAQSVSAGPRRPD